jgi:MarR family transcriptional regulator, organic hydroperoxide resistance regulator
MATRTKRTSPRSTDAPPPGATVTRPELLAGGTDLPFRQFVHDMLAFAGHIQEVRNRLAAMIGLSGTQYTILIAISHLLRAEGGVGVNRVAEHLHLSGAFVTIEVNRLVDAGLVSKRSNPEDRRRVLLTLTAKARNLLDRLRPVQRPVNDTLFESISAAEFDLLRRVMGRLVANGGRALRLVDYLAEASTSTRTGGAEHVPSADS